MPHKYQLIIISRSAYYYQPLSILLSGAQLIIISLSAAELIIISRSAYYYQPLSR
jgi:hypothetical protein